MKHALLIVAVAAAAAMPAQAQDRMAFRAGADSGHSTRIGGDFGGHRDGDRDHRGHHRPRDGGVVPWGWDDGDWAYYNNRTWQSDSFNDWWHDRPDRAFPRWMQHNENCERLWWSGGGWRC
jgi:hypothetical protein